MDKMPAVLVWLLPSAPMNLGRVLFGKGPNLISSFVDATVPRQPQLDIIT